MEEAYQYLEGIGRGKIERVAMGKLRVGVDLLGGIEELARREEVRTGVILSGVGALQKGVFRNAGVIPPDYKMKDEYRVFVDVDGPLELVSLNGWIARTGDGEINVHAHFMTTVLIDDKVVSLGGHLVKGTIASIKVVVAIGVIVDTNIAAALDPKLNQIDVAFASGG